MGDPVRTALNIRIVDICVMTLYSLTGCYCLLGAAVSPILTVKQGLITKKSTVKLP